MRVLIACEKSGRVREAFRSLGHDAFSCDLENSEDNSPYHHKGDVLDLLEQGLTWDLMIAHPPCTYLSNSGVHWLHNKFPYYIGTEGSLEAQHEEYRVSDRWVRMKEARKFFMALWNAPIPKICIENPVPHKYAELPPYSQTIQPYMFGDDASKKTCLWLKGLPNLLIPGEDQWVQPRFENGRPRWANQTKGGQNVLGPSKHRAEERSRTYEGIATALATNYGQ